MILAIIAAIATSCGCTAEPVSSGKLDAGITTFTETIIEEVILYENWD